ncbi:hypothetical protein DCAR_0205799 [Daucus carota subsp. sativus]|uniref:Uncharacterized protein n=1 Tax=Daucus carota subsp. sativus TaxID=79200 RepID=A0A162AQA3_DAUCS|nr:hypothetical protein DCAR_0205799 [Daucus carota subsp. sativus]
MDSCLLFGHKIWMEEDSAWTLMRERKRWKEKKHDLSGFANHSTIFQVAVSCSDWEYMACCMIFTQGPSITGSATATTYMSRVDASYSNFILVHSNPDIRMTGFTVKLSIS